MQEFLCPQCGASVRFESPGSVMVVCGACRSTVTKDAGVARTVGHLAAVVEDGSPVQIGTRGKQGTQAFQVVGRLRMQYEAGGWNEWYVLFDDGTNGWLSDASAQYAVTRRLPDDASRFVPGYDELAVGKLLKLDGVAYYVSDRRESKCIGGEGELPVNAADGWDARAVDCRRGLQFATVDYSDGTPVVYAGDAADVTSLDAQTLRSKEDILAATGRYRGQVLPLDCPQCGGAITIAVAMATQVICPSCSSVLDCSGDRAEIIDANKRASTLRTTIKLGARGHFNGEYTVIGVMRCEVPNDDEEPEWTEYLLFNPERGYLWLVETEDGWQKVTVSDEFPTGLRDAAADYKGSTWVRTFDYRSRVKSVFGAFNWRVKRGDVTAVTDFRSGTMTLTREASGDEITWSLATPITATTLASAFGMQKGALGGDGAAASYAPSKRSSDATDTSMGNPVMIAIFASFGLMVFSDAITAGAFLLGLIFIWAPVLIMLKKEGL